MIVIEGPDNAGKSTLAQTLAKDLKLAYFKYEWKPKSTQDIIDLHALVMSIDKQLQPKRFLILDRHSAISDAIYGPIIRGECFVTEAIEKTIYPQLTVVYCRPPLHYINDWRGREQMDGVRENIEKLVELYDHLLFDNSNKFKAVIPYDWHEQSSYELIKGHINEQLL